MDISSYITRESDGYVKLDTSKRFTRWLKLESSQELISYIRTHMDVEPLDTGYVHPIVFNAASMWISPKYAIAVSMMFNRHLVQVKDQEIFNVKKLTEEVRQQRDEARAQHEEVKKILLKTQDDLEDLTLVHEDTNSKLTSITKKLETLPVNNLSADQYALPIARPSLTEILIITALKFRVKDKLTDKKKTLYIVNRCQVKSYTQTRNAMIRRILAREEYVGYKKFLVDPQDRFSFIIPMFCTRTPNPVNLWTSFRIKYEDHFQLDKGIIRIKIESWKIHDLIESLYSFANLEPKSVQDLQVEYAEILNTKDDLDD